MSCFSFQIGLDMTSRTVLVTGTCSTSTHLQLNSKSTRTSLCPPHPSSQRKVLSTLTAAAWARMTFPVKTLSILRRRFLPRPIILWWTSFASTRWRTFTITQVSVEKAVLILTIPWALYTMYYQTPLLKKWKTPALNEHWIEHFRYIKIQPKTIDLTTRLWGITTELVEFIPRASRWSLVPFLLSCLDIVSSCFLTLFLL